MRVFVGSDPGRARAVERHHDVVAPLSADIVRLGRGGDPIRPVFGGGREADQAGRAETVGLDPGLADEQRAQSFQPGECRAGAIGTLLRVDLEVLVGRERPRPGRLRVSGQTACERQEHRGETAAHLFYHCSARPVSPIGCAFARK